MVCHIYLLSDLFTNFYSTNLRIFLRIIFGYRKVTSSSVSWLVAHQSIFRMFMKGKFDAYVLWPLAKRVQNWIVDWSTAHDFTVHTFHGKFCKCSQVITLRAFCYAVSHLLFKPGLFMSTQSKPQWVQTISWTAFSQNISSILIYW